MDVSKAEAGRCVANISPGEQRKRLAGGVAGMVLTLAALAGVLAAGLGREWRLLLFFPIWGAAVGIFKALDKT